MWFAYRCHPMRGLQVIGLPCACHPNLSSLMLLSVGFLTFYVSFILDCSGFFVRSISVDPNGASEIFLRNRFRTILRRNCELLDENFTHMMDWHLRLIAYLFRRQCSLQIEGNLCALMTSI